VKFVPNNLLQFDIKNHFHFKCLSGAATLQSKLSICLHIFRRWNAGFKTK